MASFILRGLELAACLSTTAFLAGLATVAWLPDSLQLWAGSTPIPRMVAILLLPLLATAFSLLLALLSSCDPHSAAHSSSSAAAIAAVIALPAAFSIPLQLLALYSALAHRALGTPPLALLACLLALALALAFKHVGQNYVVGIRDLWTLRSAHVWDRTHFFAFHAFTAAAVAGLVLLFFVPPGLWQLALIAAAFGLPTSLSVLYSYLIREEAAAQYQYIVR